MSGTSGLRAPRGRSFYLSRPRWLVHKLRRALAERRARPAYRAALERGTFLFEPPAPPIEALISVVMPVHRVEERHLRAAISSVHGQSHAAWELLLLDDASPDAHVARVLAEAAHEDGRIRVFRRASTGGIAVASNQLLAEVRGSYTAFLDHDDTLHPRALELVARALAAWPDTDWLFSDEDVVDEDGRHREPRLKPGWSHHLLLAFNYVAHLRVVRTETLRRVGGHREGFDGAQDWDLALRVLAAGGRFRHLPGVLYHWRRVPGSMARAAAAKPEAHARALLALTDHLRGFPGGGEVDARVLLEPASLFRVRRAAAPGMTLAALVPPETMPRPLACETVTVDPFPPSAEAAIAAARRTSADVIAVMPPAWPRPEQLTELLALLAVPGTAVVAARQVGRRRVACSGWLRDARGRAWDPWAGLSADDPGYLNLALVPGPRQAPPPIGWLARRSDLLEAWEAAADEPGPWRLPIGFARLGREVVTTPTVSLQAVHSGLPPAPPADLPALQTDWLELIGG